MPCALLSTASTVTDAVCRCELQRLSVSSFHFLSFNMPPTAVSMLALQCLPLPVVTKRDGQASYHQEAPRAAGHLEIPAWLTTGPQWLPLLPPTAPAAPSLSAAVSAAAQTAAGHPAAVARLHEHPHTGTEESACQYTPGVRGAAGSVLAVVLSAGRLLSLSPNGDLGAAVLCTCASLTIVSSQRLIPLESAVQVAGPVNARVKASNVGRHPAQAARGAAGQGERHLHVLLKSTPGQLSVSD